MSERGAILRKCDGRPDGEICADKWSCARYYVPENAAPRLTEPMRTEQGCLDFVRLAHHVGPPGSNGNRGA